MFNTNKTLNITSTSMRDISRRESIKIKCCVRQTDTYGFEFIASTNGPLKTSRIFSA